MKTTSKPLISDEQSLKGALSQWGTPVPVYDDGFGPLWIHRDSMGTSGIIRAQSWEDAYSIAEDEFFPEASETIEELVAEYGFKRESVKIIRDLATWKERDATSADYPLKDGQFVRWETRETPDPDAWSENELFCEAFGFRPNGPNSSDELKHGIYAKDLNGDSLEKLTPELLAALEIALELESE